MYRRIPFENDKPIWKDQGMTRRLLDSKTEDALMMAACKMKKRSGFLF